MELINIELLPPSRNNTGSDTAAALVGCCGPRRLLRALQRHCCGTAGALLRPSSAGGALLGPCWGPAAAALLVPSPHGRFVSAAGAFAGALVGRCDTPVRQGHRCGSVAARQMVHAKKKYALHYNKNMESETDTGFVGGGFTDFIRRGKQEEENKYRTFEIYGDRLEYQRFRINQTDKFIAIEVKSNGEKQKKPNFTSYIKIEFDTKKAVEFHRKRLFRTDSESLKFKSPELSRIPNTPSLIQMNPKSQVYLTNLRDIVVAAIEVMDVTTIPFHYNSAEVIELMRNELNIKLIMKPKDKEEYFKYLQIELEDSEEQGEIELDQKVVSGSENKPTIVVMNPKSQILLSAGEGRASVTLKIKDDQTSTTRIANNPNSGTEKGLDHHHSQSAPALRYNVPYSGANAAKICAELQSKFNGFARKACEELSEILRDAGNLVTNKQESMRLQQIGNAIIIEVIERVLGPETKT